MATEIAIMPLREGINLDDSTSAGSQAFRDVIQTVKQVKGFQRLSWGHEEENPTILRVFIDWDSVEYHVAFAGTGDFKAFMDKLGQVVNLSQSQNFHVNATPHPPLVLSNQVSPVTEILTLYFPSNYSESDRNKLGEDMKDLWAMFKKLDIYRGSAAGWIVETVPIPNTTDTGKAFQAFIGWESLEAFRSFQQTDTFVDMLHRFQSTKDLKGTTVVFYTGKLEDKVAEKM